MNSFIENLKRPMLAATVDNIKDIRLPCFVQDKEDGIRCIMRDGEALSRTFKLISNRHIQSVLRNAQLINGLDGELITMSDNYKEEPYNIVQSKIMTKEEMPSFIYRVFDIITDESYGRRLKRLSDYMLSQPFPHWLQEVKWNSCTTVDHIEAFEKDALLRGKEGIIIRSCDGLYKEGRSTLNEGYLLKLKRFTDDECIIMGYEELMHNSNEASINVQGLTERSSHLSNLDAGNKLGALICKSSSFTEFFKIGTGFTDAQRKNIWDNKMQYLGKTVTFKYQKHNMKIKPRCPVFKGFRHD